MSNDYYNGGNVPATNVFGSSATIRAEFTLLTQAFDKMPVLSGNALKPLRVNASGSGLEASTETYATLTGTETLQNKTLDAAVIANGYTEESVAANTGTAYTITFSNGTVQILTLTGNCTFTFPTPEAGKSFTLLLKQDATGSRSVTWPASVKWPSSVSPTLVSSASKGSRLTFVGDGTYWWGSLAGTNYL